MQFVVFYVIYGSPKGRGKGCTQSDVVHGMSEVYKTSRALKTVLINGRLE